MKKSIFLTLFVVVSIALLGFGVGVRADAAKSTVAILTVKEVMVRPFSFADNMDAGQKILSTKEHILSMPFNELRGLRLIDEEGRAASFSSNVSQWFSNARVERVVIPNGTPMGVKNQGNGCVVLDNAKLFLEFSVNGRRYPIGLGTGTKFAVQKTEAGKYILLPEETVKLSPPPPLDKK